MNIIDHSEIRTCNGITIYESCIFAELQIFSEVILQVKTFTDFNLHIGFI